MSTVFYTLLVVFAVIILVYLCVKYPNGRFVIILLLGIGLISSSIYCGFSLDKYYNAEGGVIGYIQSFVNPKKLDTSPPVVDIDSEKLIFDFTNTSFVEGTSNYYSYVESNVIFELEDKNYTLLVNNTPCTYNDNSVDYIRGIYKYTFYDDNMSEILTSELIISLSFNNNLTSCTITTSKDKTAVKYWNNYFAKNNFVVELLENAYTQTPPTTIQTNLYTATYMLNGEVYATETFRGGHSITTLPVPDGYVTWRYTYTDSGMSSGSIKTIAGGEEFAFKGNVTLTAYKLGGSMSNT